MTIPDPLLLEEQAGALLKERGLKLATAESCTGGLLASRITDVPGSSAYFLGGFVSYAYEAKVSQLHVLQSTLDAHGAVSKETVLEMARGALQELRADMAISISGIAGPEGGTAEKPVGTVWFALITPERERTYLRKFEGGRLEIKALASGFALELVVSYLEGGRQ